MALLLMIGVLASGLVSYAVGRKHQGWIEQRQRIQAQLRALKSR